MNKPFKKKFALPLYAVIVILQIAVYLFLILQRRIPGGVDGLQYYFTQFYFLNNAVMSGEIPQWMEYLTHGTVATWWYPLYTNILQNILLMIATCCGGILRGVHFTSVFHAGLFVDELFLLTGTWVLGRRYFKSFVTQFFVSVAVVGSAVWMTQPWYNLHFYYAIPLILYFFHLFLEKGQWRYFFMGGNLLAFQAVGNLPYFIPVTSFVVFLYFLLYLLLNSKEVFRGARRIPLNFSALLALFGVGLTFFLAYQAVSVDIDQLVSANVGRDADMGIQVEAFLKYGRNTGLLKWAELLFGFSPYFDMTLFAGTLPLMLFIVPLLFNRNKKYAQFLILILLLLCLNCGTVFAKWLYYLWPGMKYYRPLALLSPVIKLFFCFACGFGFETLLEGKISLAKKTASRFFLILTIACAGAGLFLFVIIQDVKLTNAFYNLIVEKGVWHELAAQKGVFVYEAGLPRLPIPLKEFQGMLAVTAGFLIVFAVFVIAAVSNTKEAWRRRLVALLLVLHVVQVYSYKWDQTTQRSVSLPRELLQQDHFRPMIFHKKRSERFSVDNQQQKWLALLPFSPAYWSTNLFFFVDEVGHSWRADSWLKPFDRYMRVYWNQPVDDETMFPKGYRPFLSLIFPLEHPASGKMAGLTEEKVQFFRSALLFSDPKVIVKAMGDPSYRGDIILLEDKSGEDMLEERDGLGRLTENARVDIPYRVARYDANNITLEIDNSPGEASWLFYSSVWNPHWQARVNGRAEKIYQANLAYKAVALQKGKNRVQLCFHSPWARVIYLWGGVNALFWLVILFVLNFRLWFNREQIVIKK